MSSRCQGDESASAIGRTKRGQEQDELDAVNARSLSAMYVFLFCLLRVSGIRAKRTRIALVRIWNTNAAEST